MSLLLSLPKARLASGPSSLGAPSARTAVRLNVNPADAGDQEVDVIVLGGTTAALLYAEGGAGDDTITADPIARDGYVYAYGGSGNDVLTAPGGNIGAIL